MTDTNNLTLCGRLTRDVGSDERDFGYLQSGTCFAKLSLAVNESKKGQDGNWQDYANYFEVHLYGKIAENLKPYLTKGKQILITGSLRQDRWEKDGQKNSRVVINANNVQLLGYNSDNNGQQNEAPSSYAQQYQNQQNGMTQVQQMADQVQLLGGNNGQQNEAPSSYAQQYQNQQNGMTQVQQMAGQPVQTRQAQPIEPHNDGFQEDLDFGSEYPSDIPF